MESRVKRRKKKHDGKLYYHNINSVVYHNHPHTKNYFIHHLKFSSENLTFELQFEFDSDHRTPIHKNQNTEEPSLSSSFAFEDKHVHISQTIFLIDWKVNEMKWNEMMLTKTEKHQRQFVVCRVDKVTNNKR